MLPVNTITNCFLGAGCQSVVRPTGLYRKPMCVASCSGVTCGGSVFAVSRLHLHAPSQHHHKLFSRRGMPISGSTDRTVQKANVCRVLQRGDMWRLRVRRLPPPPPCSQSTPSQTVFSARDANQWFDRPDCTESQCVSRLAAG